MILTMIENGARNERVYILRINHEELVAADLQPFDKLLIRDSETSDKVSDKLLALETIARRIEEASSPYGD